MKKKSGYISSLSKEGGWTCKCGENFRTRRELQAHRKICTEVKNLKGDQVHNNYECPYCKKQWTTTKTGYKEHIRYCLKNPDREIKKGHKLSEDAKKKLSEAMKKAHAEGRAGTFPTRKNCAHSYPENWMIGLLDREFNMKENFDYDTEYYFNGQFLDFAWPKTKLCIEVDGDQHQRFEDRKANDLRKDKLLKEEGWTEIRADWKYICNNKKEFMDNFYNILNSLDSKNENPKKYSFLGHRDLRDYKEREKLKAEGKIDSLGRVNKNVTSTEEWEKRKELILNSGIDLKKFGYVEKIVQITGLTKRQIRSTILKYDIEHFERS